MRTANQVGQSEVNNDDDSSQPGDRIPDRLVDDALVDLNHIAQKHCRRVYAPQTTRHIAEQVESLYAQIVGRQLGRGDDSDAMGAMGREADLSTRCLSLFLIFEFFSLDLLDPAFV